MNNVGKTKIILSAILTLVLLTSSVYIFMPDNVRIDIQKTKTLYSVWIDGTWELSATEYVYLWDGTKKMRASKRTLAVETIGDLTTITRFAYWKDDITTADYYIFDSSKDDVELVPIEHQFQCFNCEGKIISFEYRDLVGVTETISDVQSPQEFGNRMKIEWQDGAYYAKIFNQKVASDKFIIKYRPTQDFEVYNVRMFDPIKDFDVSILYDCTYHNETIPIMGECVRNVTDYDNCIEWELNINGTETCIKYGTKDVNYSCITGYEEVEVETCVENGFIIDYGKDSYEITGDCCNYFEVSPYGAFEDEVISCRQKLLSSQSYEYQCLSPLQQTSDDNTVFDEFGIIYDLQKNKIISANVGEYTYVVEKKIKPSKIKETIK